MKNLFSVDGKVVVITGAAGILGTSMVKHFAEQGAKVVILDRAREQGEHLAAEVKAAGGEALFLACDVLDKATLEGNYNDIMAAYGRIDVLINGAGGNMAAATVPPDKTIFDLDIEAVRKVVELNLFGTIMPTMVFVRDMAARKQGSIINIASEAALRPLTRVAGYGIAKAAVVNWTKYMCGELAIKFGEGLRVNAIAPGFLLTNQNRDQPRRFAHAPLAHHPRTYALQPLRRARGAARHAAVAGIGRLEVRQRYRHGHRRRF